MTMRRIGFVLAACAMGALAGCNSARLSGGSVPGGVAARAAVVPGAVKAILVTVTGSGITGDLRTRMAQQPDGSWTGKVLGVPAGRFYVVTAYAYDSLTVPADPTSDTAGLIFKGSTSSVTVVDGQMSVVPVTLVPYPDDGGGTGINTPPHISSVTHPAILELNSAGTLTATALDPDDSQVLTYSWSDDAGGAFSGGDGQVAVNEPSGQAVTVDYTPPLDFGGTVTITLSVSDGIATVSTSFQMGVSAGVIPVLVFDVPPVIAIDSVQTQELVQGGSSAITFELAYPTGADPNAPSTLQTTTVWSDSCGGSFSPASGSLDVIKGTPPTPQQVTYTAPAPGASGSGECDLRLTVTDQNGASVWSRVIVWVTPVSLVTGTWSGAMTEAFAPGQLTLALSQSGTAVTGTYSDQTQFYGTLSGTVSGTVLDKTFTFTVNVTAPAYCTGTITGTATADVSGIPGSLAVSYSGSTDCEGTFSSTGTLTPAEKVVFVTSTGSQRSGNLGGLAGADTFCQARAQASGSVISPGTYVAFLSTSATDAKDRIVDARYVRSDGTVVALNKAELLSGQLRSAIPKDEFGLAPFPLGLAVWTGTGADGTFDATHGDCADWTSGASSNNGSWGNSSYADGGWIESFFSPQSCDTVASVYCFQQ